MHQPRSRAVLNKIAQGAFKSVQLGDLPGSAVLLDAVRPLEQELLRRNLVAASATPAHPLWFLAETERNVFLWRNGFSLADQDLFEFWIDVPALITRRQEQVSRNVQDPGFGNPFLGGIELNSGETSDEVDYLDHLQDTFQRIYSQAFELSLIARMIQQEISKTDRTIVLLPIHRLERDSARTLQEPKIGSDAQTKTIDGLPLTK